MEANNPSNTRRKPPARRTAAQAQADAAWYEFSAARLIVGLGVVLAAWCLIALVLAGWQWLAAAKFVLAVASRAAA